LNAQAGRVVLYGADTAQDLPHLEPTAIVLDELEGTWPRGHPLAERRQSRRDDRTGTWTHVDGQGALIDGTGHSEREEQRRQVADMVEVDVGEEDAMQRVGPHTSPRQPLHRTAAAIHE
jgi:hypothetical protein